MVLFHLRSIWLYLRGLPVSVGGGGVNGLHKVRVFNFYAQIVVTCDEVLSLSFYILEKALLKWVAPEGHVRLKAFNILCVSKVRISCIKYYFREENKYLFCLTVPKAAVLKKLSLAGLEGIADLYLVWPKPAIVDSESKIGRCTQPANSIPQS